MIKVIKTKQKKTQHMQIFRLKFGWMKKKRLDKIKNSFYEIFSEFKKSRLKKKNTAVEFQSDYNLVL